MGPGAAPAWEHRARPDDMGIGMTGERVYTVQGATATPAVPITLAEAGLRERDDLQEWVLAHPEILGTEVMVVTFEFGRWRSSSGARERDRLDVLGLDTEGRLVVAELKRDRAPETVEMQAIKYAALASRFTEDTLADHHAAFLTRRGTPTDREAARDLLLAHATELDPEILVRPRLVLVAGSFPPVVTSSVVWLTQMGLDVTLQTVQAYRVVGDQTIVTVSQLFPLPDVEDFLVAPVRLQAEAAQERRTRGREASTVVRLVREGAIAEGTPLVLRPTTEVTAEVRELVAEWVAEDPARGRATWTNTSRSPLVWAADGAAYRPTAIVGQILTEATGSSRSVRGPSWWVLPDGRSLTEAAGASGGGPFDWSRLHAALALVDAGSWTTYGDLAELVGTAPQPLGQHITSCPTCPNARRVLGADGRPRQNFAWTDPTDERSQQEALEEEGVRFVAGVAADEQRVRSHQLAAQLAASPG